MSNESTTKTPMLAEQIAEVQRWLTSLELVGLPADESRAMYGALLASLNSHATLQRENEELRGEIATHDEAYASQMREIAALKGERAKLLAIADAHAAVIDRRCCPSCAVRWSCDECDEMFKAREASCLCGYRQPLGSAALSSPGETR